MSWDASLLLSINQGWASPVLDALFGWVSQKGAFALPVLLIILALPVLVTIISFFGGLLTFPLNKAKNQ